MRFEIKGMFGLEVPYSDIAGVTLVEESMAAIGIGNRTNGFGGIGNTMKGHFSSSDGRTYMLFVYANSVPTIWIERKSEKDIYLSYKDAEKTRTIFTDIMATYNP